MRTEQLLALVLTHELIKHRRLAIVDGDWKAVALDVEREVLAHYAETN